MANENVNMVRTRIIEDHIPPRNNELSPESIIIYGTATKGELYKPILAEEGQVESTFGPIPQDTMETSLVRAYYELKNSLSVDRDIRCVRIGEAEKASLELTEMQNYLSGDLAARDNEQTSVVLQAVQEGSDYNNIRVNIYESTNNASGVLLPTLMTIGGGPFVTDVEINMDPSPQASVMGTLGVVRNVYELSEFINNHPDLSQHIQCSFQPIEATVYLEVQDDGTGNAETYYELGPGQPYIVSGITGGTETWGDKLAFISEVKKVDSADDTIPGGSTAYTLTNVPVKTGNISDPTIKKFVRVVTNEYLGRITSALAGGNQLTLGCASYTVWDKTDSPTIRELTITRLTTNGDFITFEEGAVGIGDYEVNYTTGQVTFHTGAGTKLPNGFELGDIIRASYEYTVDYTESKLRSALTKGDSANYFVAGPDIIFGAGQPYPLKVTYDSNIKFGAQDVRIEDEYNIAIRFIGSRIPDIGDVVRIRFSYLPELPGSTGTAYYFTGGDDGRHMDKREYKVELAKAYNLTSNWPCKHVIPAGAYLDDVMIGYNYETGAEEEQPCGFHIELDSAVSNKSLNIYDCVGYIATRPPSSVVLTPEQEADWVAGHTERDVNDPTSPANIAATINSFRLNAIVGTPITVLPDIGMVVANPCNVYVGMKENMLDPQKKAPSRSMINMPLPTSYQRQVVSVSDLSDIDALNYNRFTAFIYNVQKQQFVIGDAPTLASYDSNLQRQFVVDVVRIAVNLVREACEPFIGKPRRPEIMLAMKTQIGKVLKPLVPDQLIDFVPTIVDVPDGHISGKTKIRLLLTTSVEIRQIDIETNVRLR